MNKYVYLISAVLMGYSFGLGACVLCGLPGTPFHGSLIPVNRSTFHAGEKVVYHCSPGFTTYENPTRICQANGKWSGHIPQCRSDIAFRKPVTHSVNSVNEINFNESLQTLVDGDTQSCANFSDGFLQIDLQKNYSVDTIFIHTNKGSNITVSIIDRQGSNDRNTPCPLLRIEPIKHESIMIYKCGSNFGHVVQIGSDTGNPDKQLIVCEIRVLPLSIPDSDDPGVKKNPDNRTFVRDCPFLPNISNGNVTIYQLRNNSRRVAYYACDYGYTINGNITRICEISRGKWTGTEPRCSLIDCGPPRPISNSYVEFTVNKTLLGSTATYKCLPGFIPQLNVKDEPLRTTSVCQETGIWQQTNFHCVQHYRFRYFHQQLASEFHRAGTSSSSSALWHHVQQTPFWEKARNSNLTVIIATGAVAVLVIGTVAVMLTVSHFSRRVRSSKVEREDLPAVPLNFSNELKLNLGEPSLKPSTDEEFADPDYMELSEAETSMATTSTRVAEAVSPQLNGKPGHSEVMDIHQLYAKVDKTKKKPRRRLEDLPSVPNLEHEKKVEDQRNEDFHIYTTVAVANI